MQDDTNPTFWYQRFQSLKLERKTENTNKKKVRWEKKTNLFYPEFSYRRVHCCWLPALLRYCDWIQIYKAVSGYADFRASIYLFSLHTSMPPTFLLIVSCFFSSIRMHICFVLMHSRILFHDEGCLVSLKYTQNILRNYYYCYINVTFIQQKHLKCNWRRPHCI